MKMVRIYIMGKEYDVPEGLTIMKAMEYAGYRYIRGAGCRAGFCGACATVFRKEGEYKLHADLACQTTVEDGMYLVQLPFTPANKAVYDITKVRADDKALVNFYPEVARCVSCNTCTKACPQELEVMDYIQASLRGDIQRAADLSFDCIQCGLCAMRCPAEIAHYHVGQLARRLAGKYLALPAPELARRVEEIRKGVFDKEIKKLMAMSVTRLKKLYNARDIEPEEEEEPKREGD